MVLLSFSHFRHELETRSKNHTIRPFNPKRFMQLTDAKQYECWWMSRRPDGYKLYNAIQTEPPYVISFERNVHEAQVDFTCTFYCHLKVGKKDFMYWTKNEAISRSELTLKMPLSEFTFMARRDGFYTPADMVLHFVSEYGLKTFNMLFIGVGFRAVDENEDL